MTLRDVMLRLRALFRRRRVENELDEELAFHLEREVHRLIEAGMSPDAARVEARRRFGSIAQAADDCRDTRGTSLVDHTARDLAYAFRTCRREPLASLTIIATIGLGLGMVAALVTIVGVMPVDFRGLMRLGAPSYWVPLAFEADLTGVADLPDLGHPLQIVGRLRPGLSSARATVEINHWATGHDEWNTVPQQGAGSARSRVDLRPMDGTIGGPSSQLLVAYVGLLVAFLLILMIACANVTNLLLARGVARQRELGVRLSLGASRGRIIRQLLTESLLLAMLAAPCGYLLSRVILHGASYAVTSTLPPEVAETALTDVASADWRVFAFLLAGAVVCTLLVGLVPAFHSTRLELVRTMRGELTRDARPGRTRHVLIALQVGVAAVLLVSAAVYLRTALEASQAKPNLRTHDTLAVGFAQEPENRAALLQATTSHAGVAAIGASWPSLIDGNLLAAVAAAKASPSSQEKRLARLRYLFVSSGFFDVLELPIVRGRAFSADEVSTDSRVVLISEQTAQRLWPGRDPVGQSVSFDRVRPAPFMEPKQPMLPSPSFTVVGVVRDIRSELSLVKFVQPDAYFPTTADSGWAQWLLRAEANPNEVRTALVRSYGELDRTFTQRGRIRSLQTLVALDEYVLRVGFWLTIVLGGIALALTLSGLFSVLSYIIEQRTQEIGVRIALGASRRTVTSMVVGQSFRPVIVGLAGGVLLSGVFVRGLPVSTAIEAVAGPGLSSFTHLSVPMVTARADAIAYVGGVLVIVVACALAAAIPARRAARIDPMTTLKRD